MLRREDGLVELLAVAEAVVADDVVDVVAALGVGGVLADRVDVALDGGRVCESSNATGRWMSRLGIVISVSGLEPVVGRAEMATSSLSVEPSRSRT